VSKRVVSENAVKIQKLRKVCVCSFQEVTLSGKSRLRGTLAILTCSTQQVKDPTPSLFYANRCLCKKQGRYHCSNQFLPNSINPGSTNHVSKQASQSRRAKLPCNCPLSNLGCLLIRFYVNCIVKRTQLDIDSKGMPIILPPNMASRGRLGLLPPLYRLLKHVCRVCSIL
jgi:hypothetical protein